MHMLPAILVMTLLRGTALAGDAAPTGRDGPSGTRSHRGWKAFNADILSALRAASRGRGTSWASFALPRPWTT